MAQWTIDPRQIKDGKVSHEVAAKIIRLYEAKPRVIVRTSRRSFRTPSWNVDPVSPARTCHVCRTVHTDAWTPAGPPREGRRAWYHQTVTAAPDGWKVICDCPAVDWCHHGYAVALTLADLDDLTIPNPGQVKAKSAAKQRVRSRLTVIPGGAR